MCYYRTYNPVAAVTNITNAQYSTRLLAASTLRNILGTKTLQEILQDREIIANQMKVNKLIQFELSILFNIKNKGTAG